MYTWIKDYIEIESNPANRRRKGQLLKQLLEQIPPSDQISFNGVLMLLEQLQKYHVTLRIPLFARVVYPVLEREIEAGNLQAIRVMLDHIELVDNYYYMVKVSSGHTKIELINRYLQQSPDDREVLQQKEAFLGEILYYSTHELPYAILYGNDEVTEEQCGILLDTLHEYEHICQCLKHSCQADIDYYTMHFNGYRDYLRHRHLYKNYHAYIHQHHLEVRITHNYYYS